jgi:hypothetical protein
MYGHQDLELAYNDLPLDAQMNTEADALATMELAEFSTTLHHVPFDPKRRVMLSIGDTTIPWHLETTIHTKASPLPALITYYLD